MKVASDSCCQVVAKCIGPLVLGCLAKVLSGPVMRITTEVVNRFEITNKTLKCVQQLGYQEHSVSPCGETSQQELAGGSRNRPQSHY